MEIIENALDTKLHQHLSNIIMKESEFPFYYVKGVANKTDTDFYFDHILFNLEKGVNSPYFNSVGLPLLGLINYKTLIRMKINCYTNQGKQIVNNFHVDSTTPHKVALYTINSNNGYTEFETGEKVISKANQMIKFNGLTKHRSVTQNDTDIRINININYV